MRTHTSDPKSEIWPAPAGDLDFGGDFRRNFRGAENDDFFCCFQGFPWKFQKSAEIDVFKGGKSG